MLGTEVVGARGARAVKGAGAPICAFFCVSVEILLLLLVIDAPELTWRRLRPVELGVLAPGFGRRDAVIYGCLIAGCGLSLRSGSQTRHFATKSTNNSSSQRRTWASVLAPGRRRLPLEFTTGRGAPVESITRSVGLPHLYRCRTCRRRASCANFYSRGLYLAHQVLPLCTKVALARSLLEISGSQCIIQPRCTPGSTYR